MSTEQEVTEGVVRPGPEPFLTATCAFYMRENGSVVAAYRTSDGQEGRRVVPRAIVKVWMRKIQQQADYEAELESIAAVAELDAAEEDDED